MTLRLAPGPDRSDWIDALLPGGDEQVGLSGLLGDLGRQARPRIVPAAAAEYGFAWDAVDDRDREWWPQGITTSGDSADVDTVSGRRVVIVSWYARPIDGARSRGSRLSVVDITEPDNLSYEHVFLVQPRKDEDSGALSWAPVRVHAGGIAWHGGVILVADTHGGVRVFELDHIVRVAEPHDGFRYVLPQRVAYAQATDETVEPFRFSFLALDRTTPGHRLVTGEYSGGDKTTRLAVFDLGDATGPLRLVDGEARAADLIGDGPHHMQGVLTIRDTMYLSTSHGAFHRGSMWTRPTTGGPWHEHQASLAVGPEDLSYWPQRDQIWSLSEYPRRRYVYAMPRRAFDR